MRHEAENTAIGSLSQEASRSDSVVSNDGSTGEINYHKTLLGLVVFALANAGVAIGFGVLWVWQYQTTPALSDHIDSIVVPWLWLAGFFFASFVSLRRITSKVAGMSVVCSLAFSFLLWTTINFVLRPLFDPWG